MAPARVLELLFGAAAFEQEAPFFVIPFDYTIDQVKPFEYTIDHNLSRFFFSCYSMKTIQVSEFGGPEVMKVISYLLPCSCFT